MARPYQFVLEVGRRGAALFSCHDRVAIAGTPSRSRKEVTSQTRVTKADVFSVRRAALRALCVLVPAAVWVSFVWFSPAKHWPLTGAVWAWFRALFHELGVVPHVGWAIKGVLFTTVGTTAIALVLRRPFILHATHLDPSLKRLFALALVVAFPVQVALGLSPGMQRFYRRFFEEGGEVRMLANVVTIISEHIWIEGAVLGLALPVGLIAASQRVMFGPRTGRLARFGLGFVEGEPRTLSTWLGVPPAAWPALVGQGVLFFLIHFSKDPFEVATSLPGGVAVGWLSFRACSCFPAMFLHLVTGVVVVGTIALAR
jgi:hypothetical protein